MAGLSTAADGVEASPTMPLPALRRRLLQVASPAGPAALGGTNPVARATRRLMVTPWFAVATGFVVAAGLWIYSPHADLRFPNGAVGETKCKQPADCQITSTQNPRIPAAAATLPVTSGNSATKLSTRTPRKVTYRLLWRSQNKFFMLVIITGRHVPRTWRLHLGMPGVAITGVEGARWQPSGSSGGTASWPLAGASWQTVGLDGGGYQNGGAPWYKAGRSFVVMGTGVFVQPEFCTFNRLSCTFTSAATTDELGGPSGLQGH